MNVPVGASWVVARYRRLPASQQWAAFSVMEALLGISGIGALSRYGGVATIPSIALMLIAALFQLDILGKPRARKLSHVPRVSAVNGVLQQRQSAITPPAPTADRKQTERGGTLQVEIVKAADWGADYVSATQIWDHPDSEITGTLVAAALDGITVTNHGSVPTELLGIWVTAPDSSQDELQPVRIEKSDFRGEKVIGPHRKESYELEYEAVFKERIAAQDLVIRIRATGHEIVTVIPPKDFLIPKTAAPVRVAQTTATQDEGARRERVRVRAVLNHLSDGELRILNALAKEGPQSILVPELAVTNLFNADLIVLLGASHRFGESFVDLHPNAKQMIVESIGAYWPRPRGPEGG